MASHYNLVEWLDGTPRPLDLEACDVWLPSRDDLLGTRLYKTPDRRWVLDASGALLEMEPARAAILLLRWGQPLPPDLGEALRSVEIADSPPPSAAIAPCAGN